MSIADRHEPRAAHAGTLGAEFAAQLARRCRLTQARAHIRAYVTAHVESGFSPRGEALDVERRNPRS